MKCGGCVLCLSWDQLQEVVPCTCVSLADKRRTPKVSQIAGGLKNCSWMLITFLDGDIFIFYFGGSVALNFLRPVTGSNNIRCVESTLWIWDWWYTSCTNSSNFVISKELESVSLSALAMPKSCGWGTPLVNTGGESFSSFRQEHCWQFSEKWGLTFWILLSRWFFGWVMILLVMVSRRSAVGCSRPCYGLDR